MEVEGRDQPLGNGNSLVPSVETLLYLFTH